MKKEDKCEWRYFSSGSKLIISWRLKLPSKVLRLGYFHELNIFRGDFGFQNTNYTLTCLMNFKRYSMIDEAREFLWKLAGFIFGYMS